jgi:protein SCO1/2
MSAVLDRSSVSPSPVSPDPAPRRRWHRPVLGLVVLATLLALGFGAARLWRPAASFEGDELRPASALLALSLARHDGDRFSTADTVGRVSLVVFGYTSCPDVCPLTLARLAQVSRLIGSEGDGLDAYFVTVDPERDTPSRLREYLGNFPGVVGLRGTAEEQAAALAAFGAVAQRREGARPGEYAMDHTALTFLIDPSGQLRLVYPYPPSAAAIVADARRLLAGAPIRVRGPWARPAAAGATSAVYLTLENRGRVDDALVGAASAAAGRVEVHRTSMDGGVMRMRPAGDVATPAGGAIAMEPGGLHVMVMDLRRDLVPGQSLPVTLRLARAGELTVRAVVRSAVSQ